MFFPEWGVSGLTNVPTDVRQEKLAAINYIRFKPVWQTWFPKKYYVFFFDLFTSGKIYCKKLQNQTRQPHEVFIKVWTTNKSKFFPGYCFQKVSIRKFSKFLGKWIPVIFVITWTLSIFCKSHWVESVRFWSYSGPDFSCIFSHLDWIRRVTEYLSVFSPNAEKCRKNADQNNSEYGYFLRSVCFRFDIQRHI